MDLAHPFRTLARRFRAGRFPRPRRTLERTRLVLLTLEDRITPSSAPFALPLPTGPKSFNSIAMGAQGNGVILYNSPDADGNYAVYAQLIDPNGGLVGDPIAVSTPTGDDNFAADVAMAPDGNFVAVYWGDAVYAREFNADGSPVGSPFVVAPVGYTLYGGMYPTVAMDPDDNFAVAWGDSYYIGNMSPYARLYSWDLSSVSQPFALDQNAADTPSWYYGPQVSIASDGTLVASYSVLDSYTAPSSYIQQYTYAPDDDGGFQISPLGSAVHLPDAWMVTPVAAPDGSFVAVTDGTQPFGTINGGITIQHFAADGTPIDANPVPVVPDAAALPVTVAGAGLDESGNLELAWYSGNSWYGGWYGGGWDMYAQQFAPDDTAAAAPMRITPLTQADGQFAYDDMVGVASTPVAVGADGSLLAGWTTTDPTTAEGTVEARHYDPIVSYQTETDTLTPASGSGSVTVVSAATTFADTVQWEYWVTNNSTHTMGQFTVAGQPEDVTDASNSLGWTMNGTGTGWAAGTGQPLLAAGQQAYFTFTTPSAYTVQPTSATAGGGTFTAAASGSVPGPGPTTSETTQQSVYDPVTGESYVQATSSATVFDDHILWQYRVTNESYIGSPSGQGQWPGYMEFDVPVTGAGNSLSDVTVPGGWTWTDIDSDFTADDDSNSYVPVGGEADFSFTTPVTAIAPVWGGAGQGHWGSAAAGYMLGAVPHFISATLDQNIPINANNDNGKNLPNGAGWVQAVVPGTNGQTIQTGIPKIRDYDATKLAAPDPDLKPLVISSASAVAGRITVSAANAAGAGRVQFWADPNKNAPFAGAPIAANGNITVYVAGYRTSEAMNDITVKVDFTGNCFASVGNGQRPSAGLGNLDGGIDHVRNASIASRRRAKSGGRQAAPARPRAGLANL